MLREVEATMAAARIVCIFVSLMCNDFHYHLRKYLDTSEAILVCFADGEE